MVGRGNVRNKIVVVVVAVVVFEERARASMNDNTIKLRLFRPSEAFCRLLVVILLCRLFGLTLITSLSLSLRSGFGPEQAALGRF